MAASKHGEEETANATVESDVPMIVHRQPFTNSDGVADVKVHGPMPVSEWAEYERSHNL